MYNKLKILILLSFFAAASYAQKSSSSVGKIDVTTGLTVRGRTVNPVLKGTVAQLRTSSGNFDNYTTTEPGREGNWFYDATDVTSADNGGTVIVTTQGKRLKRVFDKGQLNVRWFGAKGDGTTNDRTALQAAFDVLKNTIDAGTYGASTPAANGELRVFIPRGIYKIIGELNAYCGMLIEGESAGAINVTAIVQYDNTKPCIQFHPKNYTGTSVTNNSNGINTIRNIAFRSATVNDAAENAPLIKFMSPQQSTAYFNYPGDSPAGYVGHVDTELENVWFQFSAGFAVQSTEGSCSLVFRGCTFDVVRGGIQHTGSAGGSLRIYDSYFYQCVRGAIDIRTTSGYSVTCANSQFLACGHPFDGNALYRSAITIKNQLKGDNVNFNNNNFKSFDIDGTMFGGPLEFDNIEALNINNNSVFGVDAQDTYKALLIRRADVAKVSGNYFSSPVAITAGSSRMLYLVNPTGYKSLSVTGNTFENTGTGTLESFVGSDYTLLPNAANFIGNKYLGNAMGFLNAAVNQSLIVDNDSTSLSVTNTVTSAGFVKRLEATPNTFANSSTVFQNAIDELSAKGGGQLFIPAGTYRANIVLKKNVDLVGEQFGKTIIKAADSTIDVIQGYNFSSLSGKANGAGDYLLGTYNNRLENLVIDGGSKTNGNYGIRIWGHKFTFNNIIVQNCGMDGIWTEYSTYEDATTATVTDKLFEGNYTNIWVYNNGRHGWTYRGPHDSHLINFTALGNGGWAMRIEGNGGLSGSGWNSYQNDIGSFYIGGPVTATDVIASGSNVGTGIEFAEGVGSCKIQHLQTGGHINNLILRGSNNIIEGDISNGTTAITIDGAINCKVDVNVNNVTSVFNRILENGVNSFTVRVQGYTTFNSGTAFNGVDYMHFSDILNYNNSIFNTGSKTSSFTMEPLTTNTYDFGSASKIWRNVYGKNVLADSINTNKIKVNGTASFDLLSSNNLVITKPAGDVSATLNSASNAQIILNGGSQTSLKGLALLTAGVQNWGIYGGEAGGDLTVSRYGSTSNYLGSPLKISLATGDITLGTTRTITQPVGNNSTLSATTEYVDRAVGSVAGSGGTGGTSINDASASTTTTYSGTKIENLISAIPAGGGSGITTSQLHDTAQILRSEYPTSVDLYHTDTYFKGNYTAVNPFDMDTASLRLFVLRNAPEGGGGSVSGVTAQQLHDTADAVRAEMPNSVDIYRDSFLLRGSFTQASPLRIDSGQLEQFVARHPYGGGNGTIDSIRVLSTLPATGNIYFNSLSHKIGVRNPSGTHWLYFSASDSVAIAAGNSPPSNPPPTGVNYGQYSDRIEPAYTSFSNYESVPAGADNLINIHANNGPYAGGTGDIIIENRHIQQTNATGSIIWAYMPKSYGRKVIIRNCVFASSSAWDFIYASDDTEIEIYNCRFYGTSPLGTSKPRSIYGYHPYSVKVTNCYFEQTGGGVAINGWSTTAGGTLQVTLNKIKNIDGIGSSDFRQFMTVQHVEEVPNQLIEWNQVINKPDSSRVEDNINIGSSSGTSASPLTIQNNYIQGAYPYPAASGNFSGTGMTTDATDANAPMVSLPHNIHATKNQWINTLNAGMNIAAGYNVLYDDNDIVSSASLPNGTPLAGSSNAVAIFRGQPYPNDRFFNNRIINNRINFRPSAYYRSESLTEGNTLNTYATNATYADEVQQYNNWKQKLNTNQKRIGALD